MKLWIAILLSVVLIVCCEARVKRPRKEHKHRRCPLGIKHVRCEGDPCYNVKKCEAYPNARCKRSKCGECKAEFFIGKRKVDCGTATSTCPEGVRRVPCFRNPCDGASCPRNKRARCEPNYCGECSAKFFDRDGEEVDCGEKKGTTTSTCLEGVRQVQCFVNPCDGASCPKNKRARCEPNYCGECSAIFFDRDGEEVDCGETKEYGFSFDCAEGLRRQHCWMNPCRFKTCKNDRAECKSDDCGECKARFFIGEREVDCEN